MSIIHIEDENPTSSKFKVDDNGPNSKAQVIKIEANTSCLGLTASYLQLALDDKAKPGRQTKSQTQRVNDDDDDDAEEGSFDEKQLRGDCKDKIKRPEKILVRQGKTQSRRLIEQRVQRLEDQTTALKRTLRAERTKNTEQTDEIQRLARTLRSERSEGTNESVAPLPIQMVLVFLTGVLGWTPPLWFDPTNALKRPSLGSGGGKKSNVQDGEDPLCSTKRIKTGLRLAMYFLIFVVDFTDAVLDFAVSFQELLGDPAEDDPCLNSWGIWLLVATIIGRIVGGVFAVFYKGIDKSDRELSYFIAELTIFWVEDLAAWLVLDAKKMRGVPWSPLDTASWYLTIVCGGILVVPFLFRCKKITECLPRVAYSVIVTYYVVITIYAIIYVNFLRDVLCKRSIKINDRSSWLHYGICVAIHLYLVYHWVCYLHRKDKERRQQQQQKPQQKDLEAADPTTSLEDGSVAAAVVSPGLQAGASNGSKWLESVRSRDADAGDCDRVSGRQRAGERGVSVDPSPRYSSRLSLFRASAMTVDMGRRVARVGPRELTRDAGRLPWTLDITSTLSLSSSSSSFFYNDS